MTGPATHSRDRHPASDLLADDRQALGPLSRPHDCTVCPSYAGFNQGLSGLCRRHPQRGNSEELPVPRGPWIGQFETII